MKNTKKQRRKQKRMKKTRKGGSGMRKFGTVLVNNGLSIGKEVAKDAIKQEIFGSKYGKAIDKLNENKNVNTNMNIHDENRGKFMNLKIKVDENLGSKKMSFVPPPPTDFSKKINDEF